MIFDNYGRENSIKDIIKGHKLGVQQSSTRAYIVDDTTPIHDSKLYLANNETKDSLTIYLANKVLQLKIPVVTVTCLHVKSNMNDIQTLTCVSTQEEADTLIMLHAEEIFKAGKDVHTMTQDTDVMVFTLGRLTVPGLQTTMLMGTGDNRRNIFAKTNICLSWDIKSCSTSGISLFKGCDTYGNIKGIGKKTAFKAFTEATSAEHKAPSQLSVEGMPSADVVSGCETKKAYRPTQQKKLRWKHFKSQPGE